MNLRVHITRLRHRLGRGPWLMRLALLFGQAERFPSTTRIDPFGLARLGRSRWNARLVGNISPHTPDASDKHRLLQKNLLLVAQFGKLTRPSALGGCGHGILSADYDMKRYADGRAFLDLFVNPAFALYFELFQCSLFFVS